ncbi:MAG: hypothetical protein F8N36_12035 [Desulfovibrio sp.]|uniref:hypothetical protein n=1 Tax=Desulfovibrio sp. TaxID=885 RepID=UPI00135DB439|nr:hypothetical protein [Desulfovibrio sp.]MTJ93577.1 hypothetical protein [Desulfovibrio sp.]
MTNTDIRAIAPETVDIAVMRAVANLAPHARLDDIRDRASAVLGAQLPRGFSAACPLSARNKGSIGMYRSELIEQLSGGKVRLRHTARFTCEGYFEVGGDPGCYTMTFKGRNLDGSTFTVQDAGGQFDDLESAEDFARELTAEHAAFLAWFQTLTVADRAYLDQRSTRSI